MEVNYKRIIFKNLTNKSEIIISKQYFFLNKPKD